MNNWGAPSLLVAIRELSRAACVVFQIHINATAAGADLSKRKQLFKCLKVARGLIDAL